MHSKIFEKPVFKNLLYTEFQKKNIFNDQELTKEINGRKIRVFYNWNKAADGIFSFGDIEIDTFFEPQMIDGNSENIDELKFRNLAQKYVVTLWSKANRTILVFDRLKLFFNYYHWTNSKKMEKRIESGIKIFDENNLKSFSINSINKHKHKILEEILYFLPNMEFIWEHIGKNFR